MSTSEHVAAELPLAGAHDRLVAALALLDRYSSREVSPIRLAGLAARLRYAHATASTVIGVLGLLTDGIHHDAAATARAFIGDPDGLLEAKGDLAEAAAHLTRAQEALASAVRRLKEVGPELSVPRDSGPSEKSGGTHD